MYVYPEKAQSHKEPAEIGSRPWHHRSDCYVCRKQEGIEPPPSGGYIVEGKYFLVEHAPLKMSHVGTVIIQSRRHLLDFGEMTSAESTEFGSIMRGLVPAVKAVTGASRIYYLSVNEHAPHFWLVPKKKNTKLNRFLSCRVALSQPRKAGQKRYRARSERGSIDPEDHPNADTRNLSSRWFQSKRVINAAVQIGYFTGNERSSGCPMSQKFLSKRSSQTVSNGYGVCRATH